MTATSRKTAPARKRAVARPTRAPRDVDVVEVDLEGDFEDEEVDAADAQEIEAEGHYVTAMLADEEIRVVPPGAWKQSWQTALSNANFTFFAEKVVHPDDLDLYFDIDPTNDEFEQFVSEAAKRGGESLGKSRGPVRSSRHTRRR